MNQNKEQDHVVEYTVAFDNRAVTIENVSDTAVKEKDLRVDWVQTSLFPTPSKQCLIKNDCLKLRATVVRVH